MCRRIWSWSSEATCRRSCRTSLRIASISSSDAARSGIEPRLEVGDELRRDDRVLRERVVAVLLGEPRRDPLAVLPVGAEDADLLPREPARHDQPVQRVGLGLAAPHRDDRVLDARGRMFQVEHRAARVQDAEVVDVDLPVAEQPGRDLFDDAEPERLEDRHERREIDLPAGLVELDAREPLARRLVAETDDEPLVVLLHLVELEDVVDDQRPVAVGLVVLGEPGRVPVGERRAAIGADPRDQRVAEVVVPGAREPFDLLLQLLVRHLRDLHAGVDVHREEDARVLRLAERQVVVDRGAVEPLLEQVLQALAQSRVEPIPRERHDDRDAPAVEVAADQHADAAVPLQLEEPADQPTELARRRLEQLVLRERLEQRRGGLVVVRSRDQVLRRQHLLELVVQERRLGGRLHVRLRREEADHARLADDLAVGTHVSHADVVHARAPMDRRVRVGLREDQQVAVLDAPTESGLERIQQRRVGERRAADVRQDAETAPGRPRGSRARRACRPARTRDSRGRRSSAGGASRGSRPSRRPPAGSSARRRGAPAPACGGRDPASVRSRAPPAGRRAGSS